ncbi:hypothetical protein AAY473_002670 [Plecturocebus cupreus]
MFDNRGALCACAAPCARSSPAPTLIGSAAPSPGGEPTPTLGWLRRLQRGEWAAGRVPATRSHRSPWRKVHGELRGHLESWLLPLLPTTTKDKILPPSVGSKEFAPTGLLLHVSCLCCVDGNFRNMPPSRRGSERLLRNPPRRLGFQSWVGRGRSAWASPERPREPDFTEECGIPGILPNCAGISLGSPSRLRLLPLQRSQGFCSPNRWRLPTSLLKHTQK